MTFNEPLPIDAVLHEIAVALGASNAAVLMAPPGAGKTTRVPLMLLDQAWLGGAKILVLEPRRIAARAAAARMAAVLGESLGQRIGLRARLDSVVSAATRIEVITEGVFTRMIIDDPGLAGVGAVLFDEFHERSLDADLGLALTLESQQALRPDLRIMPMSATLDGARVAQLLGSGTPIIAAEGRSYPVEVRYVSRDLRARIESEVVDVVCRALAREEGSILAFLPGQREIRFAAERLAERVGEDVEIAPLHGGLEAREQDWAIRPAQPGRRKVVLATSIAETSITIEGVRVVVDCGLARVPRFDADAGVTALATVRVSLSAAEQRRGRAGRTAPGVCYRLWDEPQTQALLPYPEPEIRNADLTSLVLDCARWGVRDPLALSWLDPPPAAALAQARAELVGIGATDEQGQLSALGRGLAQLALPPRVAAMVLRAAEDGDEALAGEIAAVIVERGLGGNDCDVDARLRSFRVDRSRRADGMRRLARDWAQRARRWVRTQAAGGSLEVANKSAVADVAKAPSSTGALLARAFPDRVAKSRGADGAFLLANGRGAQLNREEPLSRARWIVVADMSGSAAAARISLAAELDEADVATLAAERLREELEVEFDAAAGAVRVRRVRRLDAIVLSSEPRPVSEAPVAAEVLAEGIVQMGVATLPWSKAQLQLRERAAFLRQLENDAWPDLGDEELARNWRNWLVPVLDGRSAVSQITPDDLDRALDLLVPWTMKQRVEAAAPSHFTAPTGNRFAIDYAAEGGPAVEIRVQELFGISEHPKIAGRLPLVLKLLSPAHRPIQITRDLPVFWRGSWAGVRADMRGRYPRHHWPESP